MTPHSNVHKLFPHHVYIKKAACLLQVQSYVAYYNPVTTFFHNQLSRRPLVRFSSTGRSAKVRDTQQDVLAGLPSQVTLGDETKVRKISGPQDRKQSKTAKPKGQGQLIPKQELATRNKSRGQEDVKLGKKAKEPWQIQKGALKEKFGAENWNPRKKLSPDAMEGIRALHKADPETFKTPVLADQFKVSPESIRRILKSKWQPNEEEAEERRQRWDKRGERIWSNLVEKGIRPPKKWREMGVGKAEPGEVPKWRIRKDKRLARKQRLASQYDGQNLDGDDDTPADSVGHRIL